MKRWGSLEDLESEKHKRVERKEKKALEKAQEAEKGMFTGFEDSCWLPIVAWRGSFPQLRPVVCR